MSFVVKKPAIKNHNNSLTYNHIHVIFIKNYTGCAYVFECKKNTGLEK
jgi:hypothetical protein